MLPNLFANLAKVCQVCQVHLPDEDLPGLVGDPDPRGLQAHRGDDEEDLGEEEHAEPVRRQERDLGSKFAKKNETLSKFAKFAF